MSDYRIFTDAAADVDPAFLSAHEVSFVPMRYTLSGEERSCSGPETAEVLHRFYEAQRKGSLTHTSQVTPQQYIDLFGPLMKSGVSILYLSLSSGLTQQFSSVNFARKVLEEKYPDARLFPVDTLSATAGQGVLVEKAVLAREAGMPLEENAALIRALTAQICHVFAVEDLMYLKRGGRIPAATAVIGTMLNIKPVLVIEPGGKLVNVDKRRGVKAAMQALVKLYTTSRDPDENRVYILHGDNTERAALLAEMIRDVNPDADLCIMPLTPIIGAHTGPDFFAAVFMGDRETIVHES